MGGGAQGGGAQRIFFFFGKKGWKDWGKKKKPPCAPGGLGLPDTKGGTTTTSFSGGPHGGRMIFKKGQARGGGERIDQVVLWEGGMGGEKPPEVRRGRGRMGVVEQGRRISGPGAPRPGRTFLRRGGAPGKQEKNDSFSEEGEGFSISCGGGKGFLGGFGGRSRCGGMKRIFPRGTPAGGGLRISKTHQNHFRHHATKGETPAPDGLAGGGEKRGRGAGPGGATRELGRISK